MGGSAVVGGRVWWGFGIVRGGPGGDGGLGECRGDELVGGLMVDGSNGCINSAWKLPCLRGLWSLERLV